MNIVDVSIGFLQTKSIKIEKVLTYFSLLLISSIILFIIFNHISHLYDLYHTYNKCDKLVLQNLISNTTPESEFSSP